jgi:hypothetical protein
VEDCATDILVPKYFKTLSIQVIFKNQNSTRFQVIGITRMNKPIQPHLIHSKTVNQSCWR